MDNPVGYLFVVGRDRGIRRRRRREQPAPDFVVASAAPSPWYEPALPGLIENLSDRERQVVVLLHAFEWSLGEIAELLEVSKSTVQSYADRAMSKLRSGLGVQA
jgi:DNA-directed RNA polymerase specialized sigma24 family protein